MVDCIYKRLIKVLKENHSFDIKSFKIASNSSVFNCRVLGNGTEHIIAFHGFGQDGGAFLSFAKNHPKFTIFSFDLPFHGETDTTDNSKFITNKGVVDLIDELINHAYIRKFSVMGFSIGAKFIYPILEQFGKYISNVWLIAPDGIYVNNWYRLATRFSLSRYLFRSILKFPILIEKFGSGLSYFGLIDSKTLLFVAKSINSEEKRNRFYNTWVHLRKLRFNSNDLKLNQKETGFSLTIFLGEKDKIISKNQIESKINQLPKYNVVMLPCEHHDLISHLSKGEILSQ